MCNLGESIWQEGLAKGKAEGLAEGEFKQAVMTAKRMLAKKYAIEEIIAITGLSINELKKLQA